MSMEDSINGLAAALNNLAAAISTNAAINTAAAPGKPAAPAPAVAAAPVHGPATAVAAPAAAPASKDYSFKDDLVPAFMTLMNTKGQETARKIIGHFDPTKERLSEAVTTQHQVNEAMALVQAMLQA